MGGSFRIRRGQHKDASALAALATQVWLQTYATEGVTPDIADYVSRTISRIAASANRFFKRRKPQRASIQTQGFG
jgi:hypothetical protein